MWLPSAEVRDDDSWLNKTEDRLVDLFLVIQARPQISIDVFFSAWNCLLICCVRLDLLVVDPFLVNGWSFVITKVLSIHNFIEVPRCHRFARVVLVLPPPHRRDFFVLISGQFCSLLPPGWRLRLAAGHLCSFLCCHSLLVLIPLACVIKFVVSFLEEGGLRLLLWALLFFIFIVVALHPEHSLMLFSLLSKLVLVEHLLNLSLVHLR